MSEIFAEMERRKIARKDDVNSEHLGLDRGEFTIRELVEMDNMERRIAGLPELQLADVVDAMVGYGIRQH